MTNPEKQTYFYAVRYGKRPGIYNTWEGCEAQIKEHDGALFKKFLTREEAQAYLTDLSGLVEVLAKLGMKDDNPPPTFIHQGSSVVYVEGLCLNNGKPHARGGYGVYWGKSNPRNASERLNGVSQTNRRAEISSVNYCLKQSQNDPGYLKIVIASDYVINSVTLWSKRWISNGWKTTKGEPVKNKDLFEVTLNLMQSQKGVVEFTNGTDRRFAEGLKEAGRLASAAVRK